VEAGDAPHLGEMMIVVKIGGSIFGREEKLLADAAKLNEPFILVHGGAAETTKLAEKTGIPVEHITSPDGFKSRRTTREMMDIFLMAVGGKINKTIVARLQKLGVNAVGICGMDGRMLSAKRKILSSVEDGKTRMIRDDYTGKIERADVLLLQTLLKGGFTPVVAPITLSEESEPLNSDGDRAAAMIASALGAQKLVLLTDVDGYFANFPNDFVPKMNSGEIDERMKKATGGMKRKLVAAREALAGGVGEVIIANGMANAPLSAAISGRGTHITK
jgi:[amino group carrier protein]-L-2-aminoadipate 6-kinase